MSDAADSARPPFRRRLLQVLVAPWFFMLVIAAAAVVQAYRDYDILALLARLDASNEGWFIDEIVVTAVLIGFCWVLRRSVLFHWEIQRRRAAETEAMLLARHDPLTGLPNRRVLLETLERGLRTRPEGATLAVMIVDLDGFKGVNDLHGHAWGDALLCAVVQRLSDIISESTMLARLGGDEFALVLPAGLAKDAIERVAARIVARMAEPFEIHGGVCDIGASVGIAMAPDDGDDVSGMLRAADIALYRAKEAGRGVHRFFELEMDLAMRRTAALKGDMRTAIEQRQIVPFYQPMIDLQGHCVEGFEVLARWNHPRLGWIMPDSFIPLAEDMRLISALSLSLLEQVCEDMQAWPERYRVSINISPSQLQDINICERIGTLLLQHGIDPARFEVEITESALVEDAAGARRTIEGLRALGLSVALDDFGTGYSSLYHLREIPFDKLKIDQSFVRDIASNTRAASYVEAIIKLGISLHLKVTAEGIEEQRVLAKLQDCGCEFGQGFLFAKPVPAEELLQVLPRLEATIALATPRRGAPSVRAV